MSSKKLVRKVHLQALLILSAYLIVSKIISIKSATDESLLVSFIAPFIFGVVSSFIFLYLFGHEDFFHFIKEVEKVEGKQEKNYLKKFKHYGKIFTVLIIGTVGGPIFSALTVRFLLRRIWSRYLLLTLNSLFSTLLTTALFKGGIRLFA